MGESFLAGQDGSGKNRAAIETGSYSFVAGSKTTWSMNKTVSLKREPKIIVIKFLGKVDSSSTDLYGETTYSTSYRYRYAVWLADGKEGSSSNQVSNLNIWSKQCLN